MNADGNNKAGHAKLKHLQDLLQTYSIQVFPDRQEIRIRNLVSITTGWENEMAAFDLEYGPENARQREKLVLRLYPGDDAHAKSAHEFDGMNLLYKAGYPVPRVWLLERDHTPFGKPFVIMERIEGRLLWSLLSDSPEANQQEGLNLFCELFVRLHTLDWLPFAADVTGTGFTNPYVFVDQWLSSANDMLRRFEKPGFLPLIDWLAQRRDQMPCSQPAVVHWDFHPSNILVRADGSPAVIDWAGMRVSDARFDLGWTLLLARSYMGPLWRDRILQGYERLAGERVKQIGYFEGCACARRLFDIVVSLSEGAEKLGMRPGADRLMQEQTEPLARVYAFMLETTGIHIAEVEQLLEQG